MKRKISVTAAVLLILTACVITFCCTYVCMLPAKSSTETASGTDDAFENAISKLRYVNDIYRNNYVGEIDAETLEYYLMQGYLVGTGDRYASYLDREDFESEMTEMSGEYVGIGIHVIYVADENRITVISVMKNSPAMEAGIRPGDVIVAVDGEDARELGYYETIDRVLGDENTEVRITLLRGEREIEITATRRKINYETVEGRMYDDKTGIVRIYEFTETTDEGVIETVERLRKNGAERLIFDMRYNPGGELSGVVDTLDYLLPAGPIVHMTDAQGNVTSEYTSDASSVEMPMAILCNEGTASAAELFTSAMKDYEKAVVVGTSTFGKGTVLHVCRLPDGSGIYFSAEMFNPPFSENFEGVGVIPDLEVELPEEAQNMNFYLIPDELDTQLQAALAALETK